MEKLSVVIITKNEEKNIERCLRSVAWADEIIVLDTGSTDTTLSLCRNAGCTVASTEWLGFGPTKQKAVAMASNTWILSIDADEEVSENLARSIRSVLKTEMQERKDAYRFRRTSWYINRWIRHCGWNNDFPVRLFNRDSAAFNTKPIHEAVETKGTVGTIEGILYHYTYPTLDSHLEKLRLYGNLTADKKRAKGKKGSIASALLHGITKFFRMYLVQAGFLDGKTGLVLAVNSAFGVYFKHLMVWERSEAEKR